MADKKGSGAGKSAETGSGDDTKSPVSGKVSPKGRAVGAKPKGSKTTPAKSASTKSTSVKMPSVATPPAKGAVGSQEASIKPDPAAPTQLESSPAAKSATGGPAKPASDTAPIAASSVPKTSTAKAQPDPDVAKPEGAKPDPVKTEPAKPTTAYSPTSQSTKTQTQAPAPQRRGGFLPMLLGGVCAAAIGFAAAYYILPQLGLNAPASSTADGVAARLDEQAQRLDALDQTIANIPGAADAPDLSGLEEGQQALEAQISDQAEQLTALVARIDSIEAQPASGSTGVSSGQLTSLRGAVADQAARLDALVNEAAQRKEAALASAQQALRLAALTRIRTALDTGSAFAPALGDLERAGMSAPDALQEVAEAGAPTQADLQESFAPAARAALATVRKSGEGGEGAGFWSFMLDQLGARSLERREGPGVDAVLSRAVDDVRQGNLQSALTEIDALPEPAKAALSEWAADVRARMQAVAAHDALAAKLN